MVSSKLAPSLEETDMIIGDADDMEGGRELTSVIRVRSVGMLITRLAGCVTVQPMAMRCLARAG